MKPMTFAKWFKSQHGPRPKVPSRNELLRTIKKGREAQAMLYTLEMYEARENSALYAWNVRDHDKGLK